MTEPQSASKINPFKSSTRTSTSAGNFSDGAGALSFVDTSFSRELSRASQRPSHATATEQMHRDHLPERSMSKLHEPAEPSTNKERREIVHSKSRSAPSEPVQGNLSADEPPVTRTPTEQKKPVAEKTRQYSEVQGTWQDNEDATGEPIAVEVLMSGHGAEKTAVSVSDEFSEQQITITTQLNLSPDLDAEIGQLKGLETASPLLTEVHATVKEIELQNNVMTGLSDQSGTAKDALSNAVVALNATASNLVGSMDEHGSESPERSTQPLTRGEQLSPLQLASRQAHPAGTADSLQHHVGGSMMPAVIEEPSEIYTPLAHAPASNARAIIAEGQSGMGVLARDTDIADNGAVLMKTAPLSVAVVDERLESQSSGRLQADLSAAVNSDQKMVTEKPEHPAYSANFLQNRQQLQQQAEYQTQQQVQQQAEHQTQQQVRQQIQQQTLQPPQNMTLLTGSPSAQMLDNSTQTPDNMFLSLPGGIVTAPVMQRAETGNTHTINAPIHMPILQNDADKAMASNIRWMANEGVKSAMVNVTPTGMGPISVSIGIEKEQMNVSIIALQGSTREALDSMLPRLREQLAAQGHDSVKVDVSDGRADHSDRGYRHQFFGEQKNSESDSDSTANRAYSGESGSRASGAENTSTLPSEGLLVVNNDGQIRNRYDVYV